MKPLVVQTFTHFIVSHSSSVPCQAFLVPPFLRSCLRPTAAGKRTPVGLNLSSPLLTPSSPLNNMVKNNSKHRRYQSSSDDQDLSKGKEEEDKVEKQDSLLNSAADAEEKVNNPLLTPASSTPSILSTPPPPPPPSSQFLPPEKQPQVAAIKAKETKERTQTEQSESPQYKKTHCMTVCVVPPPKPENKHIWRKITKARTQLRDPGLYRWPPHVNLLYPFIDINTKLNTKTNIDGDSISGSDTDIRDRSESKEFEDDNNKKIRNDGDDDDPPKDVLNLLQNAIEQCEPFTISLDSFGTFGGKHRGVLFLSPRSYRHNDDDVNDDDNGDNDDSIKEDPLVELQSILQSNFPFCHDQRKHGGTFTPHMTLSHFHTLESAVEGQKIIEQWWGSKQQGVITGNGHYDDDCNENKCNGIKTGVEFDVHEIYVLKRAGDGGQFKIVATLPLGKRDNSGERGGSSSTLEQPRSGTGINFAHDSITCNRQIQAHDPPLVFPDMPVEEEQWVYEERMKLKERRNGGGGGKRGGEGGVEGGRKNGWKEDRVEAQIHLRKLRERGQSGLQRKKDLHKKLHYWNRQFQ